jgi:hypothetical protein
MARALRKQHDIPIGVSVYPTDTSSEELKAAGTTEIKYNVETRSLKIDRMPAPAGGASTNPLPFKNMPL